MFWPLYPCERATDTGEKEAGWASGPVWIVLPSLQLLVSLKFFLAVLEYVNCVFFDSFIIVNVVKY